MSWPEGTWWYVEGDTWGNAKRLALGPSTDEERSRWELGAETTVGVNLNNDPKNPNAPPAGAAGVLWSLVQLATRHPVLTVVGVLFVISGGPYVLTAMLFGGRRR